MLPFSDSHQIKHVEVQSISYPNSSDIRCWKNSFNKTILNWILRLWIILVYLPELLCFHILLSCISWPQTCTLLCHLLASEQQAADLNCMCSDKWCKVKTPPYVAHCFIMSWNYIQSIHKLYFSFHTLNSSQNCNPSKHKNHIISCLCIRVKISRYGESYP